MSITRERQTDVNSVIAGLIRYRWLSIAFVLIVTVLAGSQLPNLQVDNSNEVWFLSGDPAQERLDAFKETFGNDDFVFILVDTDDAFAAGTLSRMHEFVERLELEVPHLLEVTWLGNAEWIEGVPGGILIEELIAEIPTNNSNREALRQKILAEPLLKDRLVSADSRTVGVLMEFENYPELGIDPRKDVPPVINTIVAEFSDLNAHVVGGPIMDYVMDGLTAVEAPRWMMMALLGMCLALAITTKSVMGVVVPAVTVVLSVVWTMGFVALVGFKLNLLVILVPTLLLCVGIGDTMHVVAELKQSMDHGMPRREALTHTMKLVAGPIFLTTLTTAIGFLAFIATDLVPLQQLGIQAAVGVVVAFLLTFLFAVPVVSFGSNQSASKDKALAPRLDVYDTFLDRIADLVVTNKLAVALIFSALIGLSFIGMSRLQIETNTIQDMPKDHPLRVAFDYVDEQMGGSMSLEFVVDTGREDGIKDAELLAEVDRFQTFLNGHPLITQTSSVLDQIKQMNRAVQENDPAAYVLPSRDEQVAEYLLLYESGGGSQLEKYVSFTYDQIRIQARTKSLAMFEVRMLLEDVDAYLESDFGADALVYGTGTLQVFSRLADLVKTGQANSFAVAFFAVMAILVFTLGSLRLGLLAMVPNVLPVAFALGAMGWAGAQLNMIGLVLAPMIIGVAVDDTVHFFVRFKRNFKELGEYDAAYRQTLRTVGRPLLFTTLVLVVGFMGILTSIFAAPRNFAWASGLAFSSALAAEFLLVPVLLSWLKPLGAERTINQKESLQGGEYA